jgi:hypothetical protein
MQLYSSKIVSKTTLLGMVRLHCIMDTDTATVMVMR